MSDDDYVHVRVPEVPDWHLPRPIGFVVEKPQLIIRPPDQKPRRAKEAAA